MRTLTFTVSATAIAAAFADGRALALRRPGLLDQHQGRRGDADADQRAEGQVETERVAGERGGEEAGDGGDGPGKVDATLGPISGRGDFLQLTDELWDDGFALKFFGAMRCCRVSRETNGLPATLRARRILLEMTTSLSGPLPRSHSPA